MTDIRRGLTASSYEKAFNAGANEYDIVSANDPDVDTYFDAYCHKQKLSPSSPRAHAWLDGWENSDCTAKEFLKDKWDAQ
jgi:hypothetical protein